MSEHARFSPSGADGWMTCPSWRSSPESSDYADDGTASHILAAEVLGSTAAAADWIGRTITVGDTPFVVDAERAAYVQTYVDNVRRFAADGTLLIEQRLPIDHVTGELNAKGTADAVVLLNDEIQIHDLKYGRGVLVEAEHNRQLMLYALGAVREYGDLLYEIKRIRLVIHQVRLRDTPTEWDLSYDELMQFGEVALDAGRNAAACLEAELHNHVDGMRYQPSEKGCRWCSRKATCTALSQFVQDSVGADFETIAAVGEPAVGAAVPADTLSAKLAACDLIEDWIAAVRAEVERRLFAGEPVPGYKLVEGRRGARKWADEAEAEALLKTMRLKHEQMYEYKVISPTSAEKLAKAEEIGPRQWPKLQQLIVQTEGKPSVAPIADKRPALVVKPVADEFETITV